MLVYVYMFSWCGCVHAFVCMCVVHVCVCGILWFMHVCVVCIRLYACGCVCMHACVCDVCTGVNVYMCVVFYVYV